MTTTSKRVLHHLTTRGGERLALCSTAEARIIRPVVANRAYVTCPRCNAILGKKAAKPHVPRAQVGGLPARDGAAMTEAKVALGVLRLGWRLTHRPPALPAHMARALKFAAHAGHLLLYGLTIFVALYWLS